MSRPILNPKPDKTPDGSWAFWKEMLYILWLYFPSPTFRHWLLAKLYPPRPGSDCPVCEGQGRAIRQERLVYFGDLLRVVSCPRCRKPTRREYVTTWDLFWIGMAWSLVLAWVLWGMGL